MITVFQALERGASLLREKDIDLCKLEARILLAAILREDQMQLVTQYDRLIDKDEFDLFIKYVKRRQLYEPIAYITGSKEFYGLDFKVSKDVLIPRPETELIIEYLIGYLNERSINKPNILELGTGSGALAVTAGHIFPKATVTAVEISKTALIIAKENATMHMVENVSFVLSDWFEQLKPNLYDVIISNPPYIDKGDEYKMAKETIKFEPEIALFASENGYSEYQKILKSAGQYLRPHGIILLEIGYDQALEIEKICSQNNLKLINIIKDISGHDRVLVIKVGKES